MRKRIEAAVLVVLAGVLGFYGYQRIGLRMGGTPSSLLSAYASEEDWMLDTIFRDIAESAAYARGVSVDLVAVRHRREHRGGVLSLPIVQVQVSIGEQETSETLALQGSFWASGNYAELARDLLGPGGSDATLESEEALTALLEPRPDVLVSEDERISARLSSSIRDAAAHEEAALLLAAFGLREASWGFDDKRFVLLRMTAHLAMARALRSDLSLGPTGRVAEAALLALSGRQMDLEGKLEALAPFAADSAPLAVWSDALYMHLTEDWRRSPSSDALLVRLMRFRAMAASLGASAAVDRMSEIADDELADWARIANWLSATNVSTAALGGDQLERELAELREVAPAYGVTASPRRWLQNLNALPERLLEKGTPRVLGWGTWAAFFQRHICGALDARDRLLRDGYGTPEEAIAFGREADSLFGELSMSPQVRVRRTTYVGGDVEDTVGMDGSITFSRRHPELVNPTNWRNLERVALHMMRKRGMPSGSSWFSSAVLTTGVLDGAEHRFEILRAVVDEGKVLDALESVAPSHPVVMQMVTSRVETTPVDYDELVDRFSERLDFDMNTLRKLLQLSRDRDNRLDLLERMCRLDADECEELGWEHVWFRRPDEARVAFERFVAEASDRVDVCNNANWLINHYYDSGRRADAMALADEAARVYCSWGIRSKAYLLERLGRFDEAEELYLADAERYDYDAVASPPLLGFYYRMATVVGEDAYETRFRGAIAGIFPEGLERLPDAPGTMPPSDGVLVDGTSRRLEMARLRGGDVIVGLDGFRVRNLNQYDVVRSFVPTTSDATAMRLRVWRQTQFLDTSADVMWRRFDVRMRAYGTPGPSYLWR